METSLHLLLVATTIVILTSTVDLIHCLAQTTCGPTPTFRETDARHGSTPRKRIGPLGRPLQRTGLGDDLSGLALDTHSAPYLRHSTERCGSSPCDLPNALLFQRSLLGDLETRISGGHLPYMGEENTAIAYPFYEKR